MKNLEDLAKKSQKLAKEIEKKREEKKKVDEDIEKLQMSKLNDFLNTNQVVLNDEFYDLAHLVKQILDSGVKADDFKEMFSLELSTSSQIETKSDDETAPVKEMTVTEEKNEK